MAKVVSITAIIITMILTEMECIILSTTNTLVIKTNMIVVEISIIEIMRMRLVVDVPQEATTNRSVKSSITINTVTRTLMISLSHQ